MSPLLTPALLVAVAPAWAPASSALAAPVQDPEQDPVHEHDFLTLYVADAARFFGSPKDAALLEALRLVDDRVAELPAEVPGFPQLSPQAVSLFAHLLTGEKSLRIGASSDPNAAFPFYVELHLMEGDPGQAGRIASALADLGRGAGVPLGEPRDDGLLPIETGAPIEVVFGARGEDVVLSAGKPVGTPVVPSGAELPEGVQPRLALHFDLGALLDTILPIAAMAAPEEVRALERLVEALALEELVLDVASGADAERSYTTVRLPGRAAVSRDLGLMPARGLQARDLALVPADAVWASLGTLEAQGTLHFVLGLLEAPLAEKGVEDPIQLLAETTGVHLEEDVVDHLGSAFGVYTSDTTGGGGLLSLVAFLELADPEGMLDTIERLQDMANGLALQHAEGYVQVRSWERGGTDFAAVTFPGLPVPFEPTLAVSGGTLFVGVTPQATLAAVDHAAGGGRGLLDNPRFRDGLPGDPEGAYAVSFLDGPRLIPHGYGWTSLLCSAIVNGTRSRKDAARDAGVVMPSYHELAQGAKASVCVTRAVGDDFVTHHRGDRSALVNLTSTVGFVASSPLVALAPMAFLGARRREAAAREELIRVMERDGERRDF